jgi:tetratricopeptide (TPR) repeat protein
MGLEYLVPAKEWEAALRLGGQTAGPSKWTAGFGVGRNSLALNYAYGPGESLGAAHRMDVTFRFGRPLEPEVRRRDLFESAQAAWSSGQTARAADLLEEIEGISPRYFPAQALGKEVNRRIEESMKPDTLFTLGIQAYDKNDFEAAGDYWRKLVFLAPDYPEAKGFLTKAELALAMERESRARSELARGREREGKTFRRSAQENQRSDRWAESLRDWRRVLSRFPKDAEALEGVALSRDKIVALAEAAEQAGEGEKALGFYGLLQEDRPDPSLTKRMEKLAGEVRSKALSRARMLYQEGVRAYDSGDLQKALPLFEEAARLNPDDASTARARDRVRTEIQNTNPGKGSR